jgi:hypothetical protein
MSTNAKTRVITVRLSEPAARRLRARARSQGVTPSALVRGLLARELGDEEAGSAAERTAKWIGAIHDPLVVAGRDARRELDTWQPDRRGS